MVGDQHIPTAQVWSWLWHVLYSNDDPYLLVARHLALLLFCGFTTVRWKSFARRTVGAVALLASVDKVDGQSRVVRTDRYLDKTKLNGVFPVGRLTWVLYK